MGGKGRERERERELELENFILQGFYKRERERKIEREREMGEWGVVTGLEGWLRSGCSHLSDEGLVGVWHRNLPYFVAEIVISDTLIPYCFMVSKCQKL